MNEVEIVREFQSASRSWISPPHRKFWILHLANSCYPHSVTSKSV